MSFLSSFLPFLSFHDRQVEKKIQDGECTSKWGAHELVCEDALSHISGISVQTQVQREYANKDVARPDFRVTLDSHPQMSFVVDAKHVATVSRKDVEKLIRDMTDQRAVGGVIVCLDTSTSPLPVLELAKKNNVQFVMANRNLADNIKSAITAAAVQPNTPAVLLNNDGTVNANSKAVKDGSLKLKADGHPDGRSKLVKSGELRLTKDGSANKSSSATTTHLSSTQKSAARSLGVSPTQALSRAEKNAEHIGNNRGAVTKKQPQQKPSAAATTTTSPASSSSSPKKSPPSKSSGASAAKSAGSTKASPPAPTSTQPSKSSGGRAAKGSGTATASGSISSAATPNSTSKSGGGRAAKSTASPPVTKVSQSTSCTTAASSSSNSDDSAYNYDDYSSSSGYDTSPNTSCASSSNDSSAPASMGWNDFQHQYAEQHDGHTTSAERAAAYHEYKGH